MVAFVTMVDTHSLLLPAIQGPQSANRTDRLVVDAFAAPRGGSIRPTMSAAPSIGVRRLRGLGQAGRGAAPYGGHGQPNCLSRRGRAFGADDDPRNLVSGALRLGTTGGARREGLALLVGLL